MSIKVTNINTGATRYDSDGAYFLEQQIEADVNGVVRKMQRAARLAAEAAKDSLQGNLANHRRSGQLYRSINSTGSRRVGPNQYIATASVGDGVEHSKFFFEDTIDGVANLFDNSIFEKKYGPTNDKRGPMYLRSFVGYEGHEHYIEEAQQAADRVMQREVNSI